MPELWNLSESVAVSILEKMGKKVNMKWVFSIESSCEHGWNFWWNGQKFTWVAT
jgi:hypothetical protein